jgi:protein-tyrosine phosphatase
MAPKTAEQLEEVANLPCQLVKLVDILVHCAHGRGRSNDCHVACLIKAGLFLHLGGGL